MDSVIRRLTMLADRLARGQGVELDDLELLGRGRKKLLRVTIDREGGVGLDDCEAFSRDFSALLDVENPIEGSYTLEVSSPGLDRPLKRLRDFAKCKGKLVKVVTKTPKDGRNVFLGRINSVEGTLIVLEEESGSIEVDFNDISRARLEVEI